MSPTVTMTKLRDPSSRKLGRSGRVAAWCHDHRHAVLVAWVLALVLMIGIATTEGDDFQDNFNGGNSQSQRAQDLLHDTFPAQAGDMAQVVFHTHDRIGTEANRARIDRVVGRLASLGAGSHVERGATAVYRSWCRGTSQRRRPHRVRGRPIRRADRLAPQSSDHTGGRRRRAGTSARVRGGAGRIPHREDRDAVVRSE